MSYASDEKERGSGEDHDESEDKETGASERPHTRRQDSWEFADDQEGQAIGGRYPLARRSKEGAEEVEKEVTHRECLRSGVR